MKEFTFSKRNSFLILLIILLTGAGILLIQRLALKTATTETAPSPEQAAAEKAVVEGAEAFFQIQSDTGKDAWLSHFCSLSTDNGCALIQMGADRLWEKYAAAKTSVQATARAIELISSTTAEQVWSVEISLSEPLPGSNKTKEEAFVLIVKTDNGWKFDRFLLEPEIQALNDEQKKDARP